MSTRSELAALRADATNQGTSIVEMSTKAGSVRVEIPPALEWPDGAIEELEAGHFRQWRRLVLSPQDFAATQALSPTTADTLEFVAAWEETSGESTGKSLSSDGSSTGTPSS